MNNQINQGSSLGAYAGQTNGIVTRVGQSAFQLEDSSHLPLFESETFKLKVDLNLQCFKSKIIFRLNKKKKELVSKVESAMKKINDL